MEDLIEKKDGELLQKHACDSSDYLIAVACGAVSGLVDIFLVGAPSQSVIGKWTDAQVDEAVKKFAEKSGWSPRPGKEGNVASAIGYLERQYKVNYDQRYSADVGGAFNMSTKNHHIKSLSHSPDIIGLFFSVLNQFTSTSSFVSGGKLVTIKTESFELQGNCLGQKGKRLGGGEGRAARRALRPHSPPPNQKLTYRKGVRASALTPQIICPVS